MNKAEEAFWDRSHSSEGKVIMRSTFVRCHTYTVLRNRLVQLLRACPEHEVGGNIILLPTSQSSSTGAKIQPATSSTTYTQWPEPSYRLHPHHTSLKERTHRVTSSVTFHTWIFWWHEMGILLYHLFPFSLIITTTTQLHTSKRLFRK